MRGKISVLMGIYNCADTLSQAIMSIRAQTYSDWELILCDDGSSDGTYAVAEHWARKDPRIILIRNEQNRGLSETLNRCLSLASGAYIARMDGDDDCLPERFEKQLAFLESHPEFDMVSSPMILFDERGPWGRTTAKEYPQPEDVVEGSPICHGPVMMRKACMDAVNGYTVDPRMLRVEDVDLWIRLYGAGYRCYNIQEALYRMRDDRNAQDRRKYRYRIHSVYVRLRGCRLLGLGLKSYLKALGPMLKGLVPGKITHWIHRHRHRNK